MSPSKPLKQLFFKSLPEYKRNNIYSLLKAYDNIRLLREATQNISIAPALANGYHFALCDDSVSFPFQLTDELIYRALAFTKIPISQRAKNIFSYLEQKVEYGSSKRTSGYSSSLQVWENKQGVCGEMSYLYVSMARFAGLRSNYVRVYQDVNGKDVSHACASVQTEKYSSPIYADIAYQKFGILHKKYESISDESAWELFRVWSKRV